MDETSRNATADTPERLQAALDAPSQVTISVRKGRVTALLPELGILVRADSVEAAHAEALRQREARIREYASEGLLDALPAPNQAAAACAGRSSLFGQLKVFLIKAAVVAALFLGMANIVGNGLRDLGYSLEKKLDGVGNWTPAMVEKHRASSAKVAEKLGPIVRELAVMFQAPAADTASANATSPGEPGGTVPAAGLPGAAPAKP